MGRRLRISRALFDATWTGLQQRGECAREAAGVWLGEQDGDNEIAREVVFLDDFPGTLGRRLQHRTSREAVRLLTQHARNRGLTIVGDIHTHPGHWVDLSEVDRAHPIEFRIGLLALVLPAFAEGSPRLTGVGLHEYLGAGEWKMFGDADVHERLRLVDEEP